MEGNFDEKVVETLFLSVPIFFFFFFFDAPSYEKNVYSQARDNDTDGGDGDDECA